MPKKTQKKPIRIVIVGDTSALISLEVGDVLNLSFSNYQYLISLTIKKELKEMSSYPDIHGKAALKILTYVSSKNIIVRKLKSRTKLTKILAGFNHIDQGKGEALIIAEENNIPLLITDDFKGIRDLKQVTTQVKIHLSIYVLAGLVLDGKLTKAKAKKALTSIAKKRTWEYAAIYTQAKKYIDDL